jgi:hypothetical protein
MQNKKYIIGILMISLLLISSFNLISAQTFTSNVCCEKTKNGAWCQNTLANNCETGFRQTPTSCDATSFCKTGCCYDSQEGLCMENTPQKVCDDGGGSWVDDTECSIPQCDLGCCVLGTQASFVTLTRCKRLSGLFGLETNFRTDVGDEATCIAVAASQDEGACVFEIDYQRTCRFTTRSECLKTEVGEGQTSETEFFKDYLCSAEELATNCGPSDETTCVKGKDEVYFTDTCGNPTNIYDAGKLNDKSYWKKVIDKSESCGYGRDDGNAGSRSCGNCDYFGGSICSEGSASYGENVCQDLNCYNTENGKDYKNGESWCIYDGNVGKGADSVGSRHFRHVCIAGEETIEPCADFRNEMCIQADIEVEGGVFTEAACRVSRWADCLAQNEEDDCLNTDRRDCYWLDGAHFTGLTQTTTTSDSGSEVFGGGKTGGFEGGVTGNVITGYASKEESGVQIGGGACLPNIPNGLKFWDEGDASSICSLGNSVCVVEYEKGLLDDDADPIKNKECLEDSYAKKMNEICYSLGDCGAYVNYVGRYTDDGAEWKKKGRKQTLNQGIMNEVKKKAGV